MSGLLRRVWTLSGVFYAENVEYRAELVLWVLSNVLPFILMGVWVVAADEQSMALTPVQMGRYFFAVFVVRNLTLVWVVWEFEQDVVKGYLSPYLLQPLDPGWRYVAMHIGERLARLPMVVLIGGVFFAIWPEAIWIPSPGTVAATAVMVALTFVMRFSAQYAFAIFAFWTERAHAIEQLWALPYLFLSGMVAPLELYPRMMQEVVLYTPFPYLIWFPSQVAVGETISLGGDVVPLWFGLVVTAGWAVFFTLLHRALWRIGLRRYSAMGA